MSPVAVGCRLPVITGVKGMGKILPSLLRSSGLKEEIMADSLGTSLLIHPSIPHTVCVLSSWFVRAN
jgi:hypothetical protein